MGGSSNQNDYTQLYSCKNFRNRVLRLQALIQELQLDKTHNLLLQRTQQKNRISSSWTWKSYPSKRLCLGVRANIACVSLSKVDRTPTMRLSGLSLVSTAWKIYRRLVAMFRGKVKAISASTTMINSRESTRSKRRFALWTFSPRS